MTPKPRTNYFILTGTPGTGKTAALEGLRSRGFRGVDEVTREILSQQLAIDGPGLPSKSPLRFVQMMLSRSIESFETYRSTEDPVFFDRGIPDLVAYALRFGVDPTEFEAAAGQFLYNPTAFVFAPWKEIFVNDNERKISYEKSLEFHELILKTYVRLGFDLVQVPFDTVAARTDFILETALERTPRPTSAQTPPLPSRERP